MSPSVPPRHPDDQVPAGGRPANQVGLGPALRRAWVGYQRRLDQAMADEGFADRSFPDGRVLRMCPESAEMTISEIGRRLAISRQGASKIVADLRDRGYLSVNASATSGREKAVTVTAQAVEYLDAQRRCARGIERQLRAKLGPDAFAALQQLLAVLAPDEDPRMRDYLRKMGVREI